MNLIEFADLVRTQDNIEAFNEESRLALTQGRPGRVEVVVTDGDRVIAAAYAADDAPVELAVHASHRRRGHGTALLDQLLTQGERAFWAHGDGAGARALASSFGLATGRTLLRLRRPGTANPPPASPTNVTIRPFDPIDLPGLLAVNRRAFSDHPEQGALDVRGFEARAAEPWFDPSGLFIAERDGQIAGFHWTKVEDGIGEVYVLGVDPEAQGQGIARSLLAVGLTHLIARDVSAIDLYVEGDNHSALALYAGFGFAEAARDVLYVSRTPAAAVRGPS